ncbi:MAG: phosphocarrier protein HPr [Pirellulaceae bacterium]
MNSAALLKEKSMTEKTVSKVVTINNEQGLHLRPAELFARLANQFESNVELIKDSERVDGKSILNIVTLGAAKGTQLRIEAAGVDAEQAIAALAELFDNEFLDTETADQT